MCVCVLHICADTCMLSGPSKRSGGVAPLGDGMGDFFLSQIWKWPEMRVVRLIYCVAFTEMMKQSLALTICRHTHP